MIVSIFIHFLANFICISYILLHYINMPCFPYLFISWWASTCLHSMAIMKRAQWTWMSRYLCVRTWSPLWIYSRGITDHVIDLFSLFEENHTYFHTAAPNCIPTNSGYVFTIPYIQTSTCPGFFCLVLVILTGIGWDIKKQFSVCISLVARDVEHLKKYFLTIYISSFENSLCSFLPCFCNCVVWFFDVKVFELRVLL